MLRFMLVLAGSFYNSLGRDINAFNSNMYSTNQQQCQSLLGHAWQCWTMFGNNPMCSDIIQKAWQCSGQGSMVLFQALDIDTAFPQEQGSMQTITIGEE